MDQDFKQKIATDFGLSSLSATEQERMIEKIGNLLFESVVERAIDQMDDQTIDDLDEAVVQAGQNYSAIISFLHKRVPGFEMLVSDELTRLKRATSHIFT